MYSNESAFSLVNDSNISNRSVIYPTLTPWGKGIATCITYDPPLVELPVGSKNRVKSINI